MFQFSGFAPITRWHVFNMPGCPIGISADQLVCANPRSLSQLITSFFASESLGIPHTLLFCLLYFLSFIFFVLLILSIIFSFKYFYLIVISTYVENVSFSICQWTYWSLRFWKSLWFCFFICFNLLRFSVTLETPSGEYRSRTGDLLRARQAL